MLPVPPPLAGVSAGGGSGPGARVEALRHEMRRQLESMASLELPAPRTGTVAVPDGSLGAGWPSGNGYGEEGAVLHHYSSALQQELWGPAPQPHAGLGLGEGLRGGREASPGRLEDWASGDPLLLGPQGLTHGRRGGPEEWHGGVAHVLARLPRAHARAPFPPQRRRQQQQQQQQLSAFAQAGSPRQPPPPGVAAATGGKAAAAGALPGRPQPHLTQARSPNAAKTSAVAAVGRGGGTAAAPRDAAGSTAAAGGGATVPLRVGGGAEGEAAAGGAAEDVRRRRQQAELLAWQVEMRGMSEAVGRAEVAKQVREGERERPAMFACHTAHDQTAALAGTAPRTRVRGGVLTPSARVVGQVALETSRQAARARAAAREAELAGILAALDDANHLAVEMERDAASTRQLMQVRLLCVLRVRLASRDAPPPTSRPPRTDQQRGELSPGAAPAL